MTVTVDELFVMEVDTVVALAVAVALVDTLTISMLVVKIVTKLVGITVLSCVLVLHI